MLNKPQQRRHHKDEFIDEVTIEPVPRLKSSHLSGDEWRMSYVTTLKRKGTVLFSRSYGKMEAAVAALPWLLMTWREEMDEADEVRFRDRLTADESACAQPGCGREATKRVQFLALYTKDGLGPLPPQQWTSVTQFCGEHSYRGDCGLEDSDRNYRDISESGE